jgi:hypothetical protein
MFSIKIPFAKLFGVKLNRWRFLALIGLQEKTKVVPTGHIFIHHGLNRFSIKPHFLFKIVPIR